MDIFHGFCPKIELSLIVVFHRNYVRKDRFSIFWIEHNDFKTKKFKGIKTGQKMDIFQWVLDHGFFPKIKLSLIAVFDTKYVRKGRLSRFWIENNHFNTKILKF